MSRARLWIDFLLCVALGATALWRSHSLGGYSRGRGVEGPTEGIHAVAARATEADVALTPSCAPLPEPEDTEQSLSPFEAEKAIQCPPPVAVTAGCPAGTPYYQRVIWFDPGVSEFPEQTAMAHQLAAELKGVLDRHPKAVIEIAGYADRSGPNEKNRLLSEARAEGVRRFIGREIPAAERLQTVALGAAQPWDTGRGCAARARNRRVEVRVLESERQ